MQVNSTWNMWVLSKSSLKWFPHSQYMISLLLIRGIPIESLYQQFPANFTLEIRVWIFQNYRDCRYTCNPHKFEFPALRFPHRVPVNPCKHLQCTIYRESPHFIIFRIKRQIFSKFPVLKIKRQSLGFFWHVFWSIFLSDLHATFKNDFTQLW